MQSSDLTKVQARALKNKLQPMLTYLNRLQRRMRHKGFLESDALLRRVVEATNAVHALHIEVHYLACGDVTGRKHKD